MKKNPFSKLTKKAFDQKLRRRPYENLLAIHAVEEYFLKKRGYVVRMPPPKTPVILLISGGLDSTILWYILVKEYGLDVFPLFIRSGLWHPQEGAVKFFTHLFQKRLGSSAVRSPFIATHSMLPRQLASVTRSARIDPNEILSVYAQTKEVSSLPHLAGLAGLTPILALLYSKYLLLTAGTKVTTIVAGVTAGDGTKIRSQTFSFLRTTMFFLSQFQNDTHLQFFSPLIDRSLGHFVEKSQLFAIGARAQLPLEKTYSCYRGSPIHCGVCLSCQGRRHGLAQARYPDTTIYASHLGQAIKQRVKHLVFLDKAQPRR